MKYNKLGVKENCCSIISVAGRLCHWSENNYYPLCHKKHVTNYSAHYESQDNQKQMVEELLVKRIRMHDERCVINALCVSHICEKVHEH
ncbi:hypothetical protein T10_12356 [Trichinella papuae]|uniref:Uncharacterized protein n=1 Tax=Trichinella papuae TaxID=268474 RepID=A0A0V1M1Q8_9BILA|nr:hypothetical protein T10_12356 [Trichinella papuae]